MYSLLGAIVYSLMTSSVLAMNHVMLRSMFEPPVLGQTWNTPGISKIEALYKELQIISHKQEFSGHCKAVPHTADLFSRRPGRVGINGCSEGYVIFIYMLYYIS